MVIGSMLPIVLGLVLPRKHTIQYGRAINKFLGLFLLQKRVFGRAYIPANILQAITLTIQTTFQDVSFGVYVDSRKDLTEEERIKKIAEYLGPTTADAPGPTTADAPGPTTADAPVTDTPTTPKP
jgi:hypothetical protein